MYLRLALAFVAGFAFAAALLLVPPAERAQAQNSWIDNGGDAGCVLTNMRQVGSDTAATAILMACDYLNG